MSATRKGILSISCLVWGNFLLCKSTSNPSLSQITQQIHVNTQIIRCTHQTLSRKFIFSYLKMMFRNFYLHMILKIILTQRFFCRKFIFNKDFVILNKNFYFLNKAKYLKYWEIFKHFIHQMTQQFIYHEIFQPFNLFSAAPDPGTCSCL